MPGLSVSRAPRPTPHAPHGFSVAGLVLLLGLVSLLGTVAVPRLQRTAEFLRYRAAMEDVTNLIRTMRHRAIAQRTTYELRVDAARGVIQLVETSVDAHHPERVYRTIWLPAGLEISDAPPVVSASPTGAFAAVHVMVTAPAYDYHFLILTRPSGQVELHEEPAL